MFRSKLLFLAVVAAIAPLCTPTRSEATFSVTLSVGPALGQSVTFQDTPGDPGTILIGSEVFGGSGYSFQGYSIGVAARDWSTAQSANLLATTLFTIQNNSASKPLTITIQQDTFQNPTADGWYNLSNKLTSVNFYHNGNPGGNGSDSVSAKASASMDPATTPTVTVTAADGASGAQSSTAFNKTATPFLLQQQISVNLHQGDAVTFQAASDVATAPAPPGLVLLASALPFGFLRLRLRRRKAEVATAA